MAITIMFVPSVFAYESNLFEFQLGTKDNKPLTISSNQDYFLHDQTLSISGTAIPDDTLTVRLIAPDGHFAKVGDVHTNPNNGNYDFTVHVWSEATKELPNGTYEVEIISSQNPALTESVYVNRISKESLFSGNVELSPLQQSKIGILPENVFCQDDLKLIIKAHDESPACVTESTSRELIQRGGWEYVEWEKITRWMKSEYTTDSTAVLQITDSHIGNLDPEMVNNFQVHVWSDSDPEGISLTMTETGKTTGIFDGTVFFSTDSSSGHRLQVSEGDKIFAEYDSITATASIA